MASSRLRMPTLGAVVTAAVLVVATGLPAGAASPAANWTTGGYDTANSRNNFAERTITASNVSGLHQKWVFTTTSDVSATPAVDDTKVYFPDNGGGVYAVNKATGQQAWRADVPTITGIASDYARTTPAIAGNLLILGDQGGKFGTPDHPTGAYVFALNKNTGALVWRTQVESQFAAIVTQSAQVIGNNAYVGVASNEEAYAASAVNGGSYVCCSFRGSMLSLEVKSGHVNWKTYVAPAGWSGNGVWGSTPSYDASRGLLYISTGNNYSAPAEAVACLQTATDPETCLPPDNYFDSIVALRAATGQVAWATRAIDSDVWNVDCGLGFPPFDEVGPNCPPANVKGPDFDFGQAPTLLTVTVGGKKVDAVGAGQKAGIFWLLNRATGALLWKTQVGVGGTLGGAEWGSSQDGTRIYTSNANSGDLSQPGHWDALDPSTGQVLWTTHDPAFLFPYQGYSAVGAVSSANGVVYACTMNQAGTMFAMDARTGQVRWQFDSGGSCNSGAAISGGVVYWGSGYRVFAPFSTGNNKLYAFSL